MERAVVERPESGSEHRLVAWYRASRSRSYLLAWYGCSRCMLSSARARAPRARRAYTDGDGLGGARANRSVNCLNECAFSHAGRTLWSLDTTPPSASPFLDTGRSAQCLTHVFPPFTGTSAATGTRQETQIPPPCPLRCGPCKCKIASRTATHLWRPRGARTNE